MNRREMLKKLSYLAGGSMALSTISCDRNGNSITDAGEPNYPEEPQPPLEYPGVPKSDFYEVTIIEGEEVKKLAVFQNTCPEYQPDYMNMIPVDQYPLDLFQGRSISWTDFSFEDSITVEIRLLNNSEISLAGNTVKILPSRFGINPEVDGDIIRFTLNEPGQFSVEIGSEGYKNGLMIFANPPETDIPDSSSDDYFLLEEADEDEINSIPGDYKGIYFKKGMHNIGVYNLPDNIKNIYFEEGSWVYGSLRMDGNFGVKIWGRGVLSSAKLNYRESHCIEAINFSNNITVEGIVIADVKYFALRLISSEDTVRWVKIIGGWTYNCDGIRPGPNSTVSNCFIWANDDSIKPYRDNITFTDCVCWHLNNGGVIQLSWGWGDSTNVTLRRIDILHGEWNNDNNNRGVISCVGDKFEDGDRFGQQRNWLIEDLVIETPVPLIFRISPNSASPNHIDGMIFKDWDAKMNMNSGFNNYIEGNDPENKYSGLVFDNFKFNGTVLTSSNWKSVGNFVVRNIEAPEFN